MVRLNLVGLVSRKLAKGFRPGLTQTGLFSQPKWPAGAWNVSKDCTSYTEKTKAFNRYLANVQYCFCIYNKTTRFSQEVALILKNTVYVHDINLYTL